jgi:anti-sigma factor RsiW
MTCAHFDSRLDALLDGHCSPSQWHDAEVHLAACARCRRLFDAVSGCADDGLDDEGHEALAASVLAKTSGNPCASARDRLCDLVDGGLPALDRELVEGHLARCEACAALAATLAAQAPVLASFADWSPRVSFVPQVLAATSRRPVEPSFGDRVEAWFRRVSERPRFSLEVAYVMTVLLLIVLGNPVDAFKEASVRVQPRVSAVTRAMSAPLLRAREAGTERIANVERAIAPRLAPKDGGTGFRLADLRTLLDEWWRRYVVAPFESITREGGEWMARAAASLRRSLDHRASEPGPPAAR